MKTPFPWFVSPSRVAVIAAGAIALTAGILTPLLVAQDSKKDADLLKEAQDAFRPLPKGENRWPKPARFRTLF